MYELRDELPSYDVFTEEADNVVTMKNDMAYFYWHVYEDGTIIFNEDLVLGDPILQRGIERTNLRKPDFIELIYVYSGTFRQYIVDDVYEFNQGDFYFLDRNTMHYELIADNNCFVIFLNMSPAFFDQVFMEALNESPLKAFLKSSLNVQQKLKQFLVFTPNDQIKEVNSLVESVLQELEIKSVGWKHMVKGSMIRLMDILISSYRNKLTEFDKKQMDSIIYDEVITYIVKHYATVTIDDLETQFHYNTAYYNRLIKKYTKMTYIQYVQKVRLSKAKEFLRNTNDSINQIIKKVGYNNKGYFYRIFKEKENMTPQEYRGYFHNKKFLNE